MTIHIIAEFRGVEPRKISKVETVKKIFDTVIRETNLNVLNFTSHQFNPYGVTCMYLLSESHLCVHTWPEYSYLTLDLFSCDRNDEKAFKALELIQRLLKPEEMEVKTIRQKLLGEIDR